MCLAVPGQIVYIEPDSSFGIKAKVNFGGIYKEIDLSYVPDAEIGDYVIVHVGFALSKIDESEAEKIFQYLQEMGELASLEEKEAGLPSKNIPDFGERKKL